MNVVHHHPIIMIDITIIKVVAVATNHLLLINVEVCVTI